MIYLGPLLIVGCAVYFTSRRIWLPGIVVAAGFVTWLVTAYGYQLDYPYFEAPGLRHRGDGEPLVALGPADDPPVAVRRVRGVLRRCRASSASRASRRAPGRRRRGRQQLVAVAWALTGEITSARGSNASANALVANLPKPLDWVDVATGRQPVTFFGENIGDANGVWLLEFWNRSIVHDWTLDATAPRPDPTLTPDVKTTDGRMRPDPGTDYVLDDRRRRGARERPSTHSPGSCCAGSHTRGGCRRRSSDGHGDGWIGERRALRRASARAAPRGTVPSRRAGPASATRPRRRRTSRSRSARSR